ncbi:MAG: hypothetical protein JSU61_04340 [Fidelibacterota bacterium]|nr:MAG: hypothetical protein JSU61_04340 [Candidatus Neomarinimicrobiota bacterium]
MTDQPIPNDPDIEHEEDAEEPEEEEFGELLKFTAGGFAGGLLAGAVLDALGFQRSGLGQWLVRTLAGEGESIFEGFYAFRQRLRQAAGTMAEAYGWGKLIGMAVPWAIDGLSRLAGINVYGIEGFYIAYFYALSDQFGANISGLLFFRRREGTWGRALARYIRHPVMLTSLAILLLVPVGLLGARLLGFSPTTQVYTALETIAANLCWLPPTVGWLRDRRHSRSSAST